MSEIVDLIISGDFACALRRCLSHPHECSMLDRETETVPIVIAVTQPDVPFSIFEALLTAEGGQNAALSCHFLVHEALANETLQDETLYFLINSLPPEVLVQHNLNGDTALHVAIGYNRSLTVVQTLLQRNRSSVTVADSLEGMPIHKLWREKLVPAVLKLGVLASDVTLQQCCHILQDDALFNKLFFILNTMLQASHEEAKRGTSYRMLHTFCAEGICSWEDPILSLIRDVYPNFVIEQDENGCLPKDLAVDADEVPEHLAMDVIYGDESDGSE